MRSGCARASPVRTGARAGALRDGAGRSSRDDQGGTPTRRARQVVERPGVCWTSSWCGPHPWCRRSAQLNGRAMCRRSVAAHDRVGCGVPARDGHALVETRGQVPSCTAPCAARVWLWRSTRWSKHREPPGRRGAPRGSLGARWAWCAERGVRWATCALGQVRAGLAVRAVPDMAACPS